MAHHETGRIAKGHIAAAWCAVVRALLALDTAREVAASPLGAGYPPTPCLQSAIAQKLPAIPRGVAHNAGSHARLTAEHSPITCDRLALWAAVYSNEVYLTI